MNPITIPRITWYLIIARRDVQVIVTCSVTKSREACYNVGILCIHNVPVNKSLVALISTSHSHRFRPLCHEHGVFKYSEDVTEASLAFDCTCT